MEKCKGKCQREEAVGNQQCGSVNGGKYTSVEEVSPKDEQKEKVSQGTVNQTTQGSLSNLFSRGGAQNKIEQNKSNNRSQHSRQKKSASEHSSSPKRANPLGSKQVSISHIKEPTKFLSHIGNNILNNSKIIQSDPSSQPSYRSSIYTNKYKGEQFHLDKRNANQYQARNISITNLKPNAPNSYGKSNERRENFGYGRYYQPQEYRGLENLGSTCYANSALQCLHKSKFFNLKFKEELKRIYTESQKYPLISGHYQTFLEELSKVDAQSPFVPISLKQQIASKNPIFKYGQNDSIQFFSTFLMVLATELNRSSSRNRQPIDHSLPDDQLLEKTKQRDRGILCSIVDETFTGYYKTTYTCKECEGKYVLFQKFIVHYLPVPNQGYFSKTTLQECLDTFKKEEQMGGDHAMGCDYCRKSKTTIKTMEIFEANQIIVICFKRFQGHSKNIKSIDIPLQLHPSQLVANGKASQYKNKIYRLYAAIIHSGYSLNGGHYYAYCRLDDDNWLKCNDSWVDKVKKSDINLRDAYALFYSLEDSNKKENQTSEEQTYAKKHK